MTRILPMLSCVCLLASVSAGGELPGQETKKVLELKIGVALHLPATRLRFLAVNIGAEDVATTPLATSGNRIVVITPDGKEVEHATPKLFPPSALIRIPPGKSHSWDMDIATIMQFREVMASGWYGVYWSIEDAKSNILWFYKPEPETKPDENEADGKKETVVSGYSWAQETDDRGLLVLSSEATKKEILPGEPLVVKILIRNGGGQPQALRNLPKGRGLAELDWRLRTAQDDQPWREVELRRVSTFETYVKERAPSPVTMAPGEQITDYLTVWFAAYGDVPEERSLVFRRPGVYRYRITLLVKLRADQPLKRLHTEGRINVTGRPKGFSEMVRELRGIMFDDSRVPYRHVQELDSLLAKLGDSPYAKYVKWMRIRSYLTGGQDERGNNVLEGNDAEEQAALLWKLSEDLLSEAKGAAPPIVRDALTTKGIVLLVRGRKSEGRKILKELEAKFPRSKGMEKLRTWAY